MGSGGLMTRTNRLCVAVDLEGYGRRSHTGQERAQDVRRTLLDGAWLTGAPGAGERQPNGDGEGAVADERVGICVLPRFLALLREGLRRANPEDRVVTRYRLRVAADHGPAGRARNGFAGDAVVRASRLLDSGIARRALDARPGSDLAVVLSEPVHAALRASPHAYPAFPAAEFAPVHVVDPAKAFAASAWVHVGAPVPAARQQPVDGGAGGAEPSPGGDAMRVEVADGGQVGAIVQIRELHGGLVLGRAAEAPR
ncbi:MAG: hypothetical protein OJJ54_04930 [Pseudonocardia sp.]|nr:hypothetical protein [Pseudonocardia sp.]